MNKNKPKKIKFLKVTNADINEIDKKMHKFERKILEIVAEFVVNEVEKNPTDKTKIIAQGIVESALLRTIHNMNDCNNEDTIKKLEMFKLTLGSKITPEEINAKMIEIFQENKKKSNITDYVG